MSTQPFAVPSTDQVVSTGTAAQVLNNVLAVENAAPALPGAQKAQIVLNTVEAVASAAPAILSLIQMFVSIFNATGVFKRSK